ncbi:MAG: replicative DNA helicase [Candidatus Omnitrophota bacterium]|jgi:replicative DNA helicase|nr:replicative DNA helicase [Candidatus Omnitrophota bacterium]
MPSQETIEKLPPQSLEAEMAVLGSMLLDREATALAIEMLNHSYFYKDAHKKIYSAIIKLFDENRAVDIVTVVEELKKNNALDDAGGPSYITSIASGVPTAANIVHYVKIVKEKYILRNLINASTQIAAECYSTSHDADTLVDKAEQIIFDIASKKVESRSVPLRDIIRSSIETIDNLYQRKENITGLATGFRDLDMKTAGLQPSDLIVIAGRPSMGKSALAACIVEHAGVVDKKPVAFFSLEMSKEQLVQRMLCSHARVDAHKVRTGFLSQADWPRLVTAAGKLSEAPIFIDDTPGVSVMEIRAKARRLKAQHDIQLIVLDYLQLMQGPYGSDSRQQEISEISRSLKALARELNVPLIAISQLSRAVEQRSDHRPQLSDLRESGAIEQDADLVILLLREEYYNPTEENKGLAETIIAKQRNGPVGSINLTFVGEYMRFENLMNRSEDFVGIENADADMERV